MVKTSAVPDFYVHRETISSTTNHSVSILILIVYPSAVFRYKLNNTNFFERFLQRVILVVSDTSSMSSRNFPASFWNSNYHSHHSTSQVYHPDTVYHHHSTAANPTDPWQTHYQQYTAAAAHHHHR